MTSGQAVKKIALEAVAHLQAGDAVLALDGLTRDSRTTRKHPFLCYLAGLAHASLGASEKALSFYDRAIALRNDYVEAHNGRALMLQELGRADEARQAYDRLLKLDPWDARRLAQLRRFFSPVTGSPPPPSTLTERRWSCGPATPRPVMAPR